MAGRNWDAFDVVLVMFEILICNFYVVWAYYV